MTTINGKKADRFSDKIVRSVVIAVAFGLVFQTGISSSTTPTNGKLAAPPDFTGVYQLVSNNANLPAGLKNTGSPEEIPLQPFAVASEKTVDLEQDGAKICVPIGPFRMMAWPRNKIELLTSPGRITMLFENIALGHERIFYLDRLHDPKLRPLWNGDSVGHWEGDTLLVDTTNFNGSTWLNGNGAQHSDSLHLVERYRLVGDRKYLEVNVMIEDSKVLTTPYSYRRYYERVETEIQEDFCTDDLINKRD